MNNTLTYNWETFGPWWNSPEFIASWFWKMTHLDEIVTLIIHGDNESIKRLNSLFITLGMSHRIDFETREEDIKYILRFLSQESQRTDFVAKVETIILQKIDSSTAANMRDFTERVWLTLGVDSAPRLLRLLENQELKEEDKTLYENLWDCILAMLKTFWIVGGTYYILNFFRIIWFM